MKYYLIIALFLISCSTTTNQYTTISSYPKRVIDTTKLGVQTMDSIIAVEIDSIRKTIKYRVRSFRSYDDLIIIWSQPFNEDRHDTIVTGSISIRLQNDSVINIGEPLLVRSIRLGSPIKKKFYYQTRKLDTLDIDDYGQLVNDLSIVTNMIRKYTDRNVEVDIDPTGFKFAYEERLILSKNRNDEYCETEIEPLLDIAKLKRMCYSNSKSLDTIINEDSLMIRSKNIALSRPSTLREMHDILDKYNSNNVLDSNKGQFENSKHIPEVEWILWNHSKPWLEISSEGVHYEDIASVLWRSYFERKRQESQQTYRPEEFYNNQ